VNFVGRLMARFPEDILLAQLQMSLLNNKGRDEENRRQQGERLAKRLSQVLPRMDQAHQDKLDGKIGEEFWMRKSAEWQTEENQIRASIRGLETVSPERLLDAARILKLANKAYFLYVKQDHTERIKLLKMVLSNCGIDAVSGDCSLPRCSFDCLVDKLLTGE